MAEELTLSEFKVDLRAFSDAIDTVTKAKNAIDDDLSQIKTQLADIDQHWQSYASETFADFQKALTLAAQDLVDTLGDMITRMHATYENYQHIEQINTKNLT